MTKRNHLFEHLSDPAFRDQRSPVALTANSNRLCLGIGAGNGDWRTVVSLISGPSRWPVAWFPDANIAFRPETEAVWEALRIAGLRIKGGVAALSTVVLAEMEEWLNAPYHLEDRARRIKAALDSRTWLRMLDFSPTSPFAAGAYGYTHLLGIRRRLALPLADGSTRLGTPAADKGRTMNAIKDKVGLRAQGLAKKGRIAAEEKGVISISDELHCLMVVTNALVIGLDSVILTADGDFLEIFFKVQWFFDTHYRAWLAAKMVKDGWYGPPVREVAGTDGYFNGPLTLYRRPTPHLQEVLPPIYDTVRVGVLYVSPRGQIYRMVFPFERRMLDMLKMRAQTNGRCTDLFGDANIHVDLGPLKDKLDGLYLGIGRDEVRTVEGNGVRSLLSMLDCTHSLSCLERYVRLGLGPPRR